MKLLQHTIKESLRLGICNEVKISVYESLRIGLNDQPEESILEEIFNTNEDHLYTDYGLYKNNGGEFTPDMLRSDISQDILYDNDFNNVLDDLENIFKQIFKEYNHNVEVKKFDQSEKTVEIEKALDLKTKKYSNKSIIKYYIGVDYSYIKYDRNEQKRAINDDWDMIIKRAE